MKIIKNNDCKNKECRTIIEVFFDNANRLTDKTAVIAGDEKISYERLKKLAIGINDYLVKNGINPGDKIILKAPPTISYIVTLLGISLCGAVSVPLEKTIPETGIDDIAKILDAKLSIVNFETDRVDYLTYEELMKYAENFAQTNDTEKYKIKFPNIDDISVILYTTGTTGKSKGVVLTNRNSLAALQNTTESTGMSESDINAMPSPLNHSYAFRRTLGSLYHGGTVIFLNGVTSVKNFIAAFENHKATTLTIVPSAMEYVLKMSGDLMAKYKDQIKYIEIGAETVSKDLIERLLQLLPNTDIVNTYGASEAGCCVGINYRKYPEKLNSIGCDAVNAEIFFTDENHNEIKADSSKNCGFISMRGPMVMVRYENDPELTDSVLGENEFYTNDLGYRDDEGFIYLLGRKGEVINVGGNKVSPIEVEEIANKSPMVCESACIPCKDPNGILENVPKLFVVVEEGTSFSESELKNFMATQLEPYKVPVVYEIIEELPKTYNLKIQRNKLHKDN